MIADLMDVLSPSTRAAAQRWYESFTAATPFRHAVIDDFFSPDVAEGLLREFPPFDPERAKNEFGKVGGKATIPGIKKLGATYAKVDDLLQSRAFLDWMSEVTGIPALQYDPDYFGGGTHENLEGQELDPHVDFNRHHRTGTYRRLNLIVYLNKNWAVEWGGGIEIHSNPRDPANNVIRTYAPIFNRAVMFETHEHSWHGFRRIVFPNEAKGASRKSLSVYMYTEAPPESGATAPHMTFYVQRPISDFVEVGDVVDASRLRELEILVRKRDEFIDFYQHLEIQHNETIDILKEQIEKWARSVYVPVSGPIEMMRETRGFEPDGWMLTSGTIKFQALQPLSSVNIKGFVPGASGKVRITAATGTQRAETTVARGNQFEVSLALRLGKGAIESLTINVSEPYVPAREGGGDERLLGCSDLRVTFS